QLRSSSVNAFPRRSNQSMKPTAPFQIQRVCHDALPWLISFSLGRMKVLVFGTSGSGKSTYARALATREGLTHLDLDSIVWEPGKIAVQRPRESVAASLRRFIDAQSAWVIEGCYGELVRAASPHCTLLVFLNPGRDACLANNLKRSWEPHKYASLELQTPCLASFKSGWPVTINERMRGHTGSTVK